MAQLNAGGTNGGVTGLADRGLGHWVPWLMVAIVGVFGWRWLTRERTESPPADRGAVVAKTTSAAWRGTWREQKGPGIIRFDAPGGIYSPDGVTLLSFRPSLRRDEATFRVYVKGVPWILCMTKSGDVARLTGIRDSQTGMMPLAIASGGTATERTIAVERQRVEARSMLVPAKMGRYVKADAAATVDPPTGTEAGEGRGEAK